MALLLIKLVESFAIELVESLAIAILDTLIDCEFPLTHPNYTFFGCFSQS